jgi:hypothetical protein
MSLFIEVNSVEKKCPVIINLDHVAEVAPLSRGGCALFFSDSAGSGSKSTMNVTDSYELFRQLVMHMVTADDIAKKVERLKGPKLKSETTSD